MNWPAIVQRRVNQAVMVRSMGGSRWNALRMLVTGRSGKFRARKAFRQNWLA